jgi:hypothetical protein
MKEFLDIIKGIGFYKTKLNKTEFIVYKYDKWTIFFNEFNGQETTFTLTYHPNGFGRSSLRDMSASHNDNPISDHTLLFKYFKQELRELKLNQIGI